MGKTVRFGNVRFEPSYYHAMRDDGLQFSFTKSERLILIELTRNPHKVYSRDRLLDAISGQGSDASDRNIDFVINRIRKKLGDAARNPEYIATYYGEGYAWISDSYERVPRSTGAHIVVGPIRGIGHMEDFVDKARDFSTRFRVCLSKQMQPDQKVVLDPKCPTPDEFETGCPKFSIDLHFINSDGNLNCVFTLKEFQKGTVLHVTRKTLFSEIRDIESKLAEEIAHQVSDAIWRSYITNTGIETTPNSSPLHVSLFDAANKISSRRGNWKDNDAILRRAVSDDDNDSVAKLMLATNIHLKYIEDGMETMLGPDTRLKDEDEVESLVLSCLPRIQSNDILVLAAAKLLFFLDRGYRRFAVEMAENAFRNSTAIATSLTIVGQMRMFLGEFDQAIDFLNQAQELSEDGTQFQYYLMFIKCQTYMAAGNWGKLREALDEFYEKVPEAKYSVSIFFASAGDNNISPEAKVMANNITKEKAVAILNITNYVYARLFTDDEPKLNIFRGLVAVMSECFGSEIIPDEIRSSIPILFQANQS